MSNTPRRRRSDVWKLEPVVLSFVLITVIFLIVLIVFGSVLHKVQQNSGRIKELVHQNTGRIADIQKSRLESCKTTYGGIRKVFLPLYPPKPRTPAEQKRIDTFEGTIKKLQKKCIKQVTPPKINGKGAS